MLKEITDNSDAPIFDLVDRNALTGLLNDEFTQPWYGQLMTGPQTMAYMIQLNYWLENTGLKSHCRKQQSLRTPRGPETFSLHLLLVICRCLRIRRQLCGAGNFPHRHLLIS